MNTINMINAVMYDNPKVVLTAMATKSTTGHALIARIQTHVVLLTPAPATCVLLHVTPPPASDCADRLSSVQHENG